jgi:hypothetical protein
MNKTTTSNQISLIDDSILTKLIPNSTNFNNKKTNKYFNKSQTTNIKKNEEQKEIYPSNINKKVFKKHHKKSLSKNNFLYLNKNEIMSTKKHFQKIPAKILQDEFETDLNFETTGFNEFYIKNNDNDDKPTTNTDYLLFDENNLLNKSCNNLQNENDSYIKDKLNSTDIESLHLFINYENLYKITKFYSDIVNNLENLNIFQKNFKETFEIIEKWFDMTSSGELYHLEVIY